MAKSNRKGRGRLSSIDLLPPEAGDLVEWAAKELAARERTQKDIHAEFNERLLDLDPELEPISASAFNRHAIKLADIQRRMKETSHIVSSLSEQMQPGDVDELTVVSGQAVKTLVMEILTTSGEAAIDTKGAMELARALMAATQAQNISTKRRQQVEAEFEAKADAAIGKASKSAGLNADQIAQLRRDFLGVRS